MFKTHRTYDLSTGIKGNTIAVFNDGVSVKIIYHRTIVVEKKRTTITLRNNGWDTVSTRTVINRALEQLCTSKAYLFRKKGETFLSHNGTVQPFVSGMTLKSAKREAA